MELTYSRENDLLTNAFHKYSEDHKIDSSSPGLYSASVTPCLSWKQAKCCGNLQHVAETLDSVSCTVVLSCTCLYCRFVSHFSSTSKICRCHLTRQSCPIQAVCSRLSCESFHGRRSQNVHGHGRYEESTIHNISTVKCCVQYAQF